MNSSPNYDSAIAEKIRGQRLAGQLNDGLHLASQTLTTSPTDWEVMGEAVRILICLGQTETATRLYQAFTADPALGNNLPPEALVRLALQMERHDLLENMDPPLSPTWLVALLNGGVDPIEPLQIDEVQVRVTNGPSVFVFSGSCPHCGNRREQLFRVSLLIQRTWVCAACFGQVMLDHAGARKALKKEFEGLLADENKGLDRDLINHLRPRMMGTAPAPHIVQALGQEYQFLLNGLVIKAAGSSERTS